MSITDFIKRVIFFFGKKGVLLEKSDRKMQIVLWGGISDGIDTIFITTVHIGGARYSEPLLSALFYKRNNLFFLKFNTTVTIIPSPDTGGMMENFLTAIIRSEKRNDIRRTFTTITLPTFWMSYLEYI